MSEIPKTMMVDGEPIVRYTFGVLTVQVNNDREFPLTMGTAALMIINRQQARSIARVILGALETTDQLPTT